MFELCRRGDGCWLDGHSVVNLLCPTAVVDFCPPFKLGTDIQSRSPSVFTRDAETQKDTRDMCSNSEISSGAGSRLRSTSFKLSEADYTFFRPKCWRCVNLITHAPKLDCLLGYRRLSDLTYIYSSFFMF